jgi:hypothetical protein
MPIRKGEIGLQTGRIKAINGNVVTVNVKGNLINIKIHDKNNILRKNQRVSVGIFDGESRIIG